MLTKMNNTPVVLALSVSILIHCGLIAGTGSMASGWDTSSTPPGRVAITLTTSTQDRLANPEFPPPRNTEGQTSPTLASDTQTITTGPVAEYVPSSLLDTPPEVVLDLPDSMPSLLHFDQGGYSVLVLRIGEDGFVEGLDQEYSDLPQTVAEEAKASFLSVRFRPGTIGGKVTRFAMRVEFVINPSAENRSSSDQGHP